MSVKGTAAAVGVTEGVDAVGDGAAVPVARSSSNSLRAASRSLSRRALSCFSRSISDCLLGQPPNRLVVKRRNAIERKRRVFMAL